MRPEGSVTPRRQIDELGFAIVDSGIDPETIDSLVRAADAIANDGQGSRRGGVRDALRTESCRGTRNETEGLFQPEVLAQREA